MTDLMTCQSKDLLVAYLYDEVTPEERSTIEAHLADCADCRTDVEGLTGVRQTLTAWETPPLRSNFRVVAEEPARLAGWRRWRTVVPYAAAAGFVLAAASLANLEVRYGNLIVHMGWGGSRESGVAVASTTTAPAQALPVGAQAVSIPWRADLVAMEQRLRGELTSRVAPPLLTPVSSRASDDEVLRRMQQLVDESEVRQQRNLALRMAEVSRDFSIQRQADLVQIQQGMGRLETRTDAEAAKARELMNYIMRVSQQEPPR